MPLPTIRIKYGWLLASVTAEALHASHGKNSQLAPHKEFIKTAEKYEAWWRPHEEAILYGMCHILGLTFRQNVIDVYVSPWFTPISDPLVVGPAFRSEDALVNTLTHELIHRLLIDNTSFPHDHHFSKGWRTVFGEEHEQKVLVHIPVHAVMKMLYLDVINRPDLLALDREITRNNKPYADAWRYVDETGYKVIIGKLSALRDS